eukprot:s1609_g9.t1
MSTVSVSLPFKVGGRAKLRHHHSGDRKRDRNISLNRNCCDILFCLVPIRSQSLEGCEVLVLNHCHEFQVGEAKEILRDIRPASAVSLFKIELASDRAFVTVIYTVGPFATRIERGNCRAFLEIGFGVTQCPQSAENCAGSLCSCNSMPMLATAERGVNDYTADCEEIESEQTPTMQLLRSPVLVMFVRAGKSDKGFQVVPAEKRCWHFACKARRVVGLNLTRTEACIWLANKMP